MGSVYRNRIAALEESWRRQEAEAFEAWLSERGYMNAAVAWAHGEADETAERHAPPELMNEFMRRLFRDMIEFYELDTDELRPPTGTTYRTPELDAEWRELKAHLGTTPTDSLVNRSLDLLFSLWFSPEELPNIYQPGRDV